MSKKTIISLFVTLTLLIALCLMLGGCGCKHQWEPASCINPKTCSLCQETEGEIVAHTWADASCSAPKTCSVCKATEGEALPHTWVEATCSAPKTCSVCKATEGEAMPHTWVDATCSAPKTCSVCQATEGEALPHTWVEATCTVPKTCSVCQVTEGEAKGHSWVNATCEKPKTCSTCSLTEGSSLGHKWQDATTEAPKTCSVCKKTEGSKIITDSRFKTANCKALFGTWQGIIKIPMNDIIAEDFTGILELDYRITFNNDGTYREDVTLRNKDAFNKSLEDYYAQIMYAEAALEGLSQAEADAEMKANAGMTVREYAKMLSVTVDWDAMFAAADSKGVYYIADSYLYSGGSWSTQLNRDSFTLTGSSLTLGTLSEMYPDLVFSRIS